MTWVPDGYGVQSGNENAGGDVQCTDGYSVRFLLADDSGEVVPRQHTYADDARHIYSHKGTEKLYSWVQMCFYGVARWTDEGEIELDSEGQPIVWVQCQTETMVYTAKDPYDYGSADERECDYQYDDMEASCTSVKEAERTARAMAGRYLSDYPHLVHREIVWDGLARWERDTWPR